MRLRSIFLFCFMIFFSLTAAQAQQISYSVERIWGDGTKHCAFTSIEKFNGAYYCTFREAESHIFDSQGNAEGKIRILRSEDGRNWEPLPLIGKQGIDLRDPKLSVMPDGRLMIIVGGSIYRNRTLQGCQPQVIFSHDGRTFTDPIPVKIDNSDSTGFDWLWRVTWHQGVGYTISYGKAEGGKRALTLYATEEGINYKKITDFQIPGYPNEATIRILPSGEMTALLRRDGDSPSAYWGVSRAPYTEWEWRDIGCHIGGPDYITLDDKRIVAGGRTHLTSAPKTSLFRSKGDGRFEHVMVLPSGGDTSYPGFIVVGNELWVSYYSTHETSKAAVYLAKIPLENF